MTLGWWPLLLVVPLALVACGGGEKPQTPELSATASAVRPSPTARVSLRPTASPEPAVPSPTEFLALPPTASPEPAAPSPTPFPTLPPTAGPEPTEVAPITTPEATPAPPEHLLGVFVVSADGSGEPVKVAEDGFVVGWSPDGTLIGISTLDPDQGGCMVAPSACFRELSVVRADGPGQPLSLGDAQDPQWSHTENKLLFYRFAREPFTTSSGRTFTGIVAEEICVADAATGQTTVLMSNGPITKVEGETVTIARSAITPPRWSPDDSRVLFGFDGALYVAAADGSQPPAKVTDSNTSKANWSPDGQQIVYTWEDETYSVAGDGSEPPRHLATGNRPYWSPDGSRIAFIPKAPSTPEIWLLDPTTGESEKLVDGDLPYTAPKSVWSPDGSLLLYNQRDGAIYIVAPTSGAPLTKLADGGSPVWSPDGMRVAFVRGFDGPDGGPIKSQLFVVNVDGSGLRLLVDNLTRWCVTYAWSPDSQRIAFSTYTGPLL